MYNIYLKRYSAVPFLIVSEIDLFDLFKFSNESYIYCKLDNPFYIEPLFLNIALNVESLYKNYDINVLKKDLSFKSGYFIYINIYFNRNKLFYNYTLSTLFPV